MSAVFAAIPARPLDEASASGLVPEPVRHEAPVAPHADMLFSRGGMRGAYGILALVDRQRTLLLLASLVLILLGARAALINYAGNPTPFLDEWYADAAHLLAPYVTGNLTIADLFAPFNEHRVFFTRLMVLLTFNLSGYLDMILQMIFTAILASVTIVAMSYALARVLPERWAAAAMILSTVINAVPYGHTNVVFAFCMQFPLMNAFSFASLWLLVDSRAWSTRWSAGLLCALASFLCMASGALTPAAAGAAHLLQAALGRRSGVKEWLGIAAIAVLTVALVSLVPHIPQADELRAHSVGQFLSGLLKLTSWPANSGLGLIILLPSVLFVWRVLADRPPLGNARWFNVMTLCWVGTQILALAAGRGQFPLQSRYFDILLVGVSIHIVSAFWLFTRETRPPIASFVALFAWLCLLGASLTHPLRHVSGDIEVWRQATDNGERNVRGYLATGDGRFLEGAPGKEVPSFDPALLRQYLDTPAIRATLPPDLLSEAPRRSWVEAFKHIFLSLGAMWLGLGALLLVLASALVARTPSGGRLIPRRFDFAVSNRGR